MKKIIAIAGSNSSKSINKILATHIANQLENVEVTTLNWENMELPLYSTDVEEADGIPENAHAFLKMISETDGVVLSLAEHNGLPTAAFKNLWDWTSRINQKFWDDKPMLLAATSPGARGGQGVLAVVKNLLPHFGGNLIADFSLPSFYENFTDDKLSKEELTAELNQKVQLFQESL